MAAAVGAAVASAVAGVAWVSCGLVIRCAVVVTAGAAVVAEGCGLVAVAAVLVVVTGAGWG